MKTTESQAYTTRLVLLQKVWWKKLLPVQLPYCLHLRHLNLGFVLDIGCGLGRNLQHLRNNGIGIDHNRTSVETANRSGQTAFLVDDFYRTDWNKPETFDSLLMSHLLEHIDEPTSHKIMETYLPLLKKNGRLVMICPQLAGYRSDETHVTFMNIRSLSTLAHKYGLKVEKSYSFPFPEWIGNYFKYNEYVVVARKLK